jgi:hypothetical protein
MPHYPNLAHTTHQTKPNQTTCKILPKRIRHITSPHSSTPPPLPRSLIVPELRPRRMVTPILPPRPMLRLRLPLELRPRRRVRRLRWRLLLLERHLLWTLVRWRRHVSGEDGLAAVLVDFEGRVGRWRRGLEGACGRDVTALVGRIGGCVLWLGWAELWGVRA